MDSEHDWKALALGAFRLDDRVAIVTGAARGIGRAVAGVLAGAGARVVMADVREQELEISAAAMCRQGLSCEARPLDVSSAPDVESFVKRVAADYGQLDVMVNNAAVIADTSALDVTEQELDRIHAVNFKGAVFGSQAAARVMIPRRTGSIVTVLSTAIDLPAPTVPAYATAKAASHQFSRSLAAQIAPFNVRVNAVAPGWTDTPINHRHSLDDRGEVDEERARAYRDQWDERIPLRTAGTPEDQAFAVLYLASPASRFVTGSVVRPNGGMVMPW